VARRRVSEIEAETEAASCPECGGDAERSGTGIWACADCGHEFTGGSYRAETPAGRGVERSLREALAEDEES
jgi:large subunit ribosomal protein L37Ae